MIKKLSLKLVLVFLVLVVSVIITSSCYAVLSTSNVSDLTLEDFGLTMDIINQKIIDKGYEEYLNYRKIFITNGSYIEIKIINDSSGNISCLKENSSSTSSNVTINFLNDSGGYLSRNVLNMSYTPSTKYWIGPSLQGVGANFMISYNPYFLSITEYDIKDSSGNLIFTGYEPAPDTSFDYSFEGIKRGQVKLNINNLNESLKMYGYVGLDTTFAVGDTLDITSNTVNLRLLASKSDNSDLNCYLYEGENLNYYIVDENNIILDTGYISEMAKGYFLYGFEVNNGVDFVFLKDGQVYWSNDLDFSYKFNNSEVFKNDDIVSMAQSSYIVSNKTLSSIDYTGYVYDTSNNLLSEAKCNFSNDLSSISISVDTTYTENNVGWNKSCYWLMSINLDGTNIDGTSIDFSDYYVKWSVPTWLNLDSIEYNGEEYTKRNGIINGFSSNGLSGMFNLKIYELIKNHIKAFDIKLDVYDSDDNLVLTYTINSDDIIRDKVVSDENNVDKEDYDILDNPNYTGGSSTTPDINNIQNWTSDDYLNLMSTDNFVWEFFKAILGNLPWWITVPLTILIFGVVIITLIRFARGA